MTSDNELEFKALGLFGCQMRIDIYKCNSYASHERGSNKNANRLIGRKYPKSTNFNDVSNIDIEILMDNINNMPIKKYSKELSNIDVNEVIQKALKKGIEKRMEQTSRKHGYLYMKNFK